MPARKKKKGEIRRVVFYIRVSSWSQDVENSREGQINALQRYADENGRIVVEIYIDEAISGRRDDRPALNRLMRDARSRNRPFDEVLVWKFDRFGRRASTVDRRATELENLGIALTAVMQPIEGKPSVVRFVRNLLSNISEYFSDNMGEDIARGKRTSAEYGVWTNSSVPFGFLKKYRLDRRRMRPFLVPDPKTAHIIVRMTRLYLEGTGTRNIAKTFNDEDVPGPTDKPWTPGRVSTMLKNIAYAGFISAGRRSQIEEEQLLVPVPEMEIITLEEYNRVQEIMASHTPDRTHPREVASNHLLSGLTCCNACECKMSPTGGERSYYNCNDKRNNISPSCDTPRPRADLLDVAVVEHVLKKVTTPENMDRLVEIVASSQTETMMEVEEELKDLDLQIESQKESRRALLGLVERKQAVEGDVAERLWEIREALTKLESKALTARAKLANEKAFTANAKKVDAYVKDLATYLRGSNLDLTKQILKELIVQVRIKPGKEKDTTTVVIRYRIPTPPSGWADASDLEELLLRKGERSLESPVQPGRYRPHRQPTVALRRLQLRQRQRYQ